MATFYPEVYQLRPWYHDFSRLGLQTHFAPPRSDQIRQLANPLLRRLNRGYVEKGERFSLRQFLRPVPPTHPINQQRKETVLEDYLRRCLSELNAARPDCLDLFCADGYYSCLLSALCPDAEITGIDLDAQEIRRAQTASRLLNARHAQFQVADVWDAVTAPHQYDLILCAGGLYHLTEPAKFVSAMRRVGGRYLVVQSVVTLESSDPDYFITPAPGWKHGSRFTHAGLGRWLEAAGWRILDATTNELEGNPRPCDRGSSYYRCIAA